MERAHLKRITRLFPDHAAAHRRLGEVKVNEDWVPVGAFWLAASNRQLVQTSIAEYAARYPAHAETAKDGQRFTHRRS